jgi:Ca-activated chloride channel family protein
VTEHPKAPVAPPPLACGAATKDPAQREAIGSAGTMTAALSGDKVLRGSDGEVFVAVDLATRDSGELARPPINMAIVLDRSGSMKGQKLEQAKAAARGLVGRLGAGDRVSLIQFDDTAQVLVSSTVTDDAGRATAIAAIDGIDDGDNTNIGDALALGRDEVLRVLTDGSVNRVLLLSDGNPTAGLKDPNALARIAAEAADRGARITTIGLGLDYNEDLMEEVADSGRGAYYYVRHASDLAVVFDGELKAIQGTVAAKVEVRLEPACPGVEIVEVYGYPTRRDGSAVVVPMPDLSGGERRKVVARLRVPVAMEGHVGVLAATWSWQSPKGGGRETTSARLGVEVTGDALAVDAAVKPTVMAKVIQIENASAMRSAAGAYAKGDQAGATATLRAQRRSAEAKAKRYKVPEPAAAEILSPLDSMDRDFTDFAPGSIGGADATKAHKKGAQVMEQ